MHVRLKVVSAFTLALFLVAPIYAQKRPVNAVADLPRYAYPYEGRVTALFERPELAAPIAAKARADVLATLADYDVTDRATLRGLHSALADIAMYQRDFATARREIETVRSLADKPLARQTFGAIYLAYIEATGGAAPGSRPGFAQAFGRAYAAGMSKLPWSLYGDKAEENVGQHAILSRAALVGGLAGLYQPQVDKGGALDENTARDLIGSLVYARDIVPLKAEILAADRDYVSHHALRKTDIWPARDVDLKGRTKLSPVVVAIWDTGFDTNLFPGQLWANPKEAANGRDNDGNGWIGDLHGIAIDEDGNRSPDMLVRPPAEIAPRMSAVADLAIGLSDQFANRATPSARRLVSFFDRASADEIDHFWQERDFFGGYFHGTHVAGIVARGNPAVRMMTVRRSFTWSTPPRRPTLAIAEAFAKAYRDQVAYMRAAGVRVVNMSWTVDIKTEYENQLAANGVPPAERAAEAAKMFAIEAQGLRDAIASVPDILFVCAAGNSNNSAEFQASVPASIEAPNVLTVSAVGSDGVPTSFTTLGPTIDIAANGYRVDSLVPGGRHMIASGTSMASPNVVNAAAKLLALDPSLSVAQLRALLVDTATPSSGTKLLNTRAAVERLR